ncbi:MAG: FtsW/RodA/SpoVE family cell cycle protein [Kiritimatiellae bacterium]|nr:FtsW/RodA/SpoVE family cell cycle protein [Kiritimatiellia bacterium]
MKAAGVLFAICMAILTGVGLVAIASVGDVQSARIHGAGARLFLLQLGFAGVGLVAAAAIARTNPSFWFRREVVLAAAALAVLGLLAVHLPGIGVANKGSARWVRIGPVGVQPSEFAKIASLLVVSWWVGDPALDKKSFVRSALAPAAWLGVLVLGLMAEPDLGSSFMLLAVDGLLLFVSGVRLRYLALFACAAGIAFGLYVAHDPERLSRITSVFGGAKTERTAERADDAFQLETGLAALAAGGATGVGLGNSLYKHYLPESHTDFILAMVGEEAGLAATLPCLLVFFAMALAGFRIAMGVPDPRQRLFALGLALHLCLSGAVNAGVVTGALPTKGLALPFVSYGGSNLVASLVAGGFLLGLAWRNKPRTGRLEDEPAPPPPPRGTPLSVGWGI